MKEANFKLAKPPIIEAVVDIDCDMPPEQDVVQLENHARACFTDRYPNFRTQVIQENRIQVKRGESPLVHSRQHVQSLQFLQDDEKQLVQVRVQGFSFNRLEPYASLDDYLQEIERTWNLFVGLASPVQVKLIRLRYINRILLPMAAQFLDLDQYLKIGPRLPDEKKMTLMGFLHHHVIQEVETGHQAIIVLASQPEENGKLPLIFDNSVVATSPTEPENWPGIVNKVQLLRALKNRIFKETLTEKCLNLFQQV
jgi:uncharacterized protein (TIGR04255 family)